MLAQFHIDSTSQPCKRKYCSRSLCRSSVISSPVGVEFLVRRNQVELDGRLRHQKEEYDKHLSERKDLHNQAKQNLDREARQQEAVRGRTQDLAR